MSGLLGLSDHRFSIPGGPSGGGRGRSPQPAPHEQQTANGGKIRHETEDRAFMDNIARPLPEGLGGDNDHNQPHHVGHDRHGQTREEQSAFASWPILLAQWTFALVYLSAFLEKLVFIGGLDWLNGYTLQYATTFGGPWIDANLPVTIEGPDFVAYDSIGGGPKFYRLIPSLPGLNIVTETPNTKIQIPRKLQAPRTNRVARLFILGI